MTTGRSVMWLLIALLIAGLAIYARDHGEPTTRVGHIELLEKLQKAQLDNETVLKELYPSSFIVFMPYGDGLIHIPNSNRASAIEHLNYDWGLSGYEYLDNNQARIVFRGWKGQMRGEISDSAHIVDSDTLEATFALKPGIEVGLFEWRDRRGVYLKVIEANQRFPIFALGIRELP